MVDDTIRKMFNHSGIFVGTISKCGTDTQDFLRLPYRLIPCLETVISGNPAFGSVNSVSDREQSEVKPAKDLELVFPKGSGKKISHPVIDTGLSIMGNRRNGSGFFGEECPAGI